MDASNKKFLKKTSYVQFQKLVELMEEFPHLATNSPSFGSNKLMVEQTWDSVAEKINAFGPPTRTGYEWKKVWHDQKCRLKRKISDNNKSLHGTGSGPCSVSNLTELELHIDRICHLSSAAAPSGKSLGLPSAHKPVDVTPPRNNAKAVAVITPTTSKETTSHKKSQQSYIISDIFIPNMPNIVTLKTSPPKTITTYSQQSVVPPQQIKPTPKQTQEMNILKKETTQQFQQQRKRKNSEVNSDKVKLLCQQMEIQNKTLDIMQKQLEISARSAEAARIQAEASKLQAEESKLQAEALKEQAVSLKEIAGYSKTMAQALTDIIKHLKDED